MPVIASRIANTPQRMNRSVIVVAISVSFSSVAL